MKDSQLPENVELLRTRVVIEKDRVFSVSFFYSLKEERERKKKADVSNIFRSVVVIILINILVLAMVLILKSLKRYTCRNNSIDSESNIIDTILTFS